LITIDDREPISVAQKIQELGEECQVKRMEVGDYVWACPSGIVRVERKAVTDLLGSMTSGRLNDQLRKLVAESSIPILLIEGKIGEWRGKVDVSRGHSFHSQWSFNAVDNILLSWQLAGLYLSHAPTLMRTPERIISLYNLTQKEEHSALNRQKIINLKEDAPSITTLVTFPGIGIKRARQIMRDYTLEQLANMELKELQKLLGKKTGEKVHAHWRSNGV